MWYFFCEPPSLICSGVSSYGAGGAAAPPLFGRVNKKSDIFISFYSVIAVNHAEKSRRLSICPATFFGKWRTCLSNTSRWKGFTWRWRWLQGDWLVCKVGSERRLFVNTNGRRTEEVYLRFQWKRTFYQFKSCPFGLASAPRIFMKLMKPIAGFLTRAKVSDFINS